MKQIDIQNQSPLIDITCPVLGLYIYLRMKNLRIAKKNPSKILKIIEVPQTYRYNSNNPNAAFSSHLQEFAIGQQKDKQSKLINFSTHRDKISRSPSNSQKIIQIGSLQKHNKFKSKSLNRSEENIKNQEQRPFQQTPRQKSIELKPKQQFSPYIKRAKVRENEKLLNFHSVNLGTHKKSLERQSSNESGRRRYSHLKIQGIREAQVDKKSEEVIQNAKELLNSGEYRKSLLLLKTVLKNSSENVQALYLSAVNWYHLEDRLKVHHFIEQIFNINPNYSAECYKIKAVCYFKTLEYTKSLNCLKQCHQRFPNEGESYELEGKVYMKMKKWKQAIDSYLKTHDYSNSLNPLGYIALCYEQLNQLDQALQFYQKITQYKDFPMNYLLKKIKIHLKKQQYEQTCQIFETYESKIILIKENKEKQEFYYSFTYAFYKQKRYSKALILIDQGLKFCQHEIMSTKFNRILLMIKIVQRDIYEAFRISERLEDAPELSVIKKFIQGVINLMRRNHNEAITILLSIQKQLGFNLQTTSRFSNRSALQFNKVEYQEVEDQFLEQIRKIYLMFLSYAYYSISQFHSAKKFIELQREIGVSQYFQLGLSYNYQMAQGIINHCQKDYKTAESHFIRAKAMYQNRLEPPFSLALNYLQLLLSEKNQVEKLQIIEKTKGQFWASKKLIGKVCNNTAASLYYFSSLLHGYLQQWKEALISIDVSIQRSEDHYWRYYYVRGMLLACIHSFKEAIGDLTAAISLSSNAKPECFLLRSKCLQIQGEGNEAFKDLQQYIALKPDDPEVHKYAGQLLFQNGAFEDSLTAFNHQPIAKTLANYDMFLTEGKSYFLLGKFKEAIQTMMKSYEIKSSEQLMFDIQVIRVLDLLTAQNQIEKARGKLDELFGDFSKMGKIFKVTDFYIIKATCFALSQLYEEAINSFQLAIKQKQKELEVTEDDDEIGIIQNKKDFQTFFNQMKYNVVICYLNLGSLEKSNQALLQINIPFDQPYYPDFVHFKKFVSQETQILKKQQVFPNRNKLSNFIPKIKLKIDAKYEVKLCIPFPKVQPPEIFPTFNIQLLSKLSVLNVERKPEAPWILRENNSIKFTQKIQTFSRLQLQDSEYDSSSTFQIISVDNEHLSKKSSRSKRMHTSSMGLSVCNNPLKRHIQ